MDHFVNILNHHCAHRNSYFNKWTSDSLSKTLSCEKKHLCYKNNKCSINDELCNMCAGNLELIRIIVAQQERIQILESDMNNIKNLINSL
jgi:hypothetical protein